ncbi:hypothetical protein [Pedobacter sp. NJ-S-72]
METIVIQDSDIAILDVLTQALEMDGYEVFALRECDDDFLAF